MVLVCSSDNRDLSQCVELTDREFLVCNLICHSRGPVSFSHLKKSTELHQEILSRVVRRLVIHGVVKKEGGRYKRGLS